MKKEKQVKAYQRRTKSGKMVTVKAHTAKYDAAEEMRKAMAKKKGAGDELEKRKGMPDWKLPMDEYMDELKKRMGVSDKESDKKSEKKTETKTEKKIKKPVGSGSLGPTRKKTEAPISAADFKAWYHWDTENDPKNAAAKRVEKALKAKMGAKEYRKFFNDATDNYSARGHLKLFKTLGMDSSDSKGTVDTKSAKIKPQSKAYADKEKKIFASDKKVYVRGSDGELKKIGTWDGKTHEVIKPKSKSNTSSKGTTSDYYSTDTLDKAYKSVMSAAKSGDAKQYRKAIDEYSTVYSHHGDHYGDKKSEAYRKKQTDAITKAAAKIGLDYSGNKLKSSTKDSDKSKLTFMSPERKKAIAKSKAEEKANRKTEKAMKDEYAGKISSQQRKQIETSAKNTLSKTTKRGFSGDTQLKQEIANWKKSPTSSSGKASRETITKLLKKKKSEGYSLTKRELLFLD